MVQAVIDIDEHANRVLSIVKAKYGLRDKSQAINLVVSEYEQSFLEPELRPVFVEKIKRMLKKRDFKTYASVEALRKDIEHA